ncbi:hypothetical protein BH10BAC5_BH10BAC5_08010 [soil metagenome]
MTELIKYDKKKKKFTIISISRLDYRFYDLKSEYERKTVLRKSMTNMYAANEVKCEKDNTNRQ